MEFFGKLEPGIFLYYKTINDEAVLIQEIKRKIETLTVPNGMIDVPYDWVVDLTSKDSKSNLCEVWTTPILEDIGITAEITAEKHLKLSKTPTKRFDDGKIFFYILVNRSKRISDCDIASFTDLPQMGCVLYRPFYINPNPRSLGNEDLPADYDGYDNDTQENGFIQDGVYPTGEKKGLGLARGAEIEYFSGKTFEVIAASARGRSHAAIGKPRDDAFYFDIDKETGWNFVAVADGLGSKKYSRRGAELATQTVVKTLRETLTKEFFKNKEDTLQQWRTEFIKHNGGLSSKPANAFAAETGIDTVLNKALNAACLTIAEEHKKRAGSVLDDYHTTLLCAAFRWFPELGNGKGGWFIASYWVGDGAAVILHPTGSDGDCAVTEDRVFVLGVPDGGDSPSAVRVLRQEEFTEEKRRKRCRFSFCDSFEAIFFTTDGVSDPFFPSDAAVLDESLWLQFYEKKFQFGCEEESHGCRKVFDNNVDSQTKALALLKWLSAFYAVGNRDDRTVLIVRLK